MFGSFTCLNVAEVQDRSTQSCVFFSILWIINAGTSPESKDALDIMLASPVLSRLPRACHSHIFFPAPSSSLRSHCRAHAAVSDHLIQHELWKEHPSMSLCTSRPGCRYTTHPQRPPPPPPSQPCSALTWGEKIYADSENAW